MTLGTVLSSVIVIGGLAALLLVGAAILLLSSRNRLTRDRLGVMVICLVLLLTLIGISVIFK